MIKLLRKYKFIVAAIIFLLLLIICSVVVFFVFFNKKDEEEKDTEPVSVTNTTECEEAVGQTFSSENFDLKLKAPCSFKKIYEVAGNASNCPGVTTETAIISFTGTYLNLDVNQCPVKPYDSQIEETYTLTSKDGKDFTVYIYNDAFDETRKFIQANSEYKLQLRATGGPGSMKITEKNLTEVQTEVKDLIESLEFEV